MLRLRLATLYIFGILNLVSAQSDTVSIDFGGNDSPLFWNNITGVSAGGISRMINSKGYLTNYGISIYDAFTGVNYNGPQNIDPSLGFPSFSSNDNFYGNSLPFSGKTEPTGGVLLNGLDPLKAYSIVCLSARSGVADNRETRYIISGLASDTFNLNASNNTSLTVSNTLYPGANGTIKIMVSPGSKNNNAYGFFYLNAMKLIYDKEIYTDTQSLSLVSPIGGEFWQVGKKPSIVWESINLANVIIEYSLNQGASWIVIDTVPAYSHEFQWTIPETPSENCLVRLTSDSLNVMSNHFFEISKDSTNCNIVVLGSSTANGTGSSTPDSSWVKLFKKEIFQHNTKFNVINLAVGGYTTYHILPTGTAIPSGVNVSVDVEHNFTKTLSFDPYAIIVNMPSNDAARGFTVSQQMANFTTIYEAAENEGVKPWICTTQPRNFNNESQRKLQREMADSIISVFGKYSIDIWNGLADNSGFIISKYNSGDGTHLNDAGHRFIFERVFKKIIDSEDTVGIPTSINTLNQEINDNSILIYPNPASGRVNIQTGGHSTVNILNTEGKLLVRKTIEKGITMLPLYLESGLYLIRVAGENNNVYTRKLVVK